MFFWGLLAATNFYAQGVGSSGDIKGTVTDPSGAVMPKVVKATAPAIFDPLVKQRVDISPLSY
jgi:hypothetical protein